jgi:hypothetical protein
MIATAGNRERVTSAAAAIGVQAGIAALLVASFAVVRQVRDEKESFITLPPLAAPKPPPSPVTIDARGRRTPPPLKAPAPPGDEPAVMAPAPSPPQAGITQPPAPSLPSRPKAYPNEIPLHPESHVKNAPVWQSEIDRRNTPLRVPCVTLTSSAAGMNGFAKEDHGVSLDIGCLLKALRDGPQFLPPVQGLPGQNAPRPHASDQDFGKALQAINARKRALYARATPADAGASP